MDPRVRHFILCQEVRVDPANNLRVDVLGLLSNIRLPRNQDFPLIRPVLCALLVTTGFNDSGELYVRIVREIPQYRILSRTPLRKVQFRSEPNQSVGLTFHVKDCSFPEAGVYWVECLFAGEVIARQPVNVMK
jgi:hypothetical protein